MTLWWWYCCRCGWTTRSEPEWAWADAAAIHHRDTEHRGAEWQPFEVSVSFYRFREPK